MFSFISFITAHRLHQPKTKNELKLNKIDRIVNFSGLRKTITWKWVNNFQKGLKNEWMVKTYFLSFC